jgi:hypothetical protein
VIAVPGDAETVTIGRGLGAGGAMGLLDQGMRGRGNELLEIEVYRDRLPSDTCSLHSATRHACGGKMLKRTDDCRIRWLIRTKHRHGLQPEDDVFLTLTAINFRDAAFSFVRLIYGGAMVGRPVLDGTGEIAYIPGVRGRLLPAFRLLRPRDLPGSPVASWSGFFLP